MSGKWHWRMVFLFCALLVPVWAAAAEFGFRIQRAEIRFDEAGKDALLDADIDYRFSEPALDALRNGVSLTLMLKIAIKQDGRWWNATLLKQDHAFSVRYHALSKLFQILDEGNELPRNFMSVNALLEAMGSLRDLPLTLPKPLSKGERYRASLSVGLDIESLPLPLRPVAYATPAWFLDSPSYTWTFAN